MTRSLSTPALDWDDLRQLLIELHSDARHEIHLGSSANGGSFFTQLKHQTLQSTLSIHAHAKGSVADTCRAMFNLQSKAPEIGLLDIKIINGRGTLTVTRKEIGRVQSHHSISCNTEENAETAYRLVKDTISNWILHMSNLDPEQAKDSSPSSDTAAQAHPA